MSNKDYAEILNYIEDYWDKVIKISPKDEGTLIGLPFPFVVPNHLIFQEMYYWDSYFIALGFENSPKERLIIDITENLLYLMERFGRIPNASRFYFLSRSQPPFLSSLVLKSLMLLARDSASSTAIVHWLKRALLLTQQEYENVWTSNKFSDHRAVYKGLSRYYDLNIWHNAAEAESGWDMTTRFQNRCLDYLPVDLNSLLFKYEKDLSLIWSILNDKKRSDMFSNLAYKRKRIMREIMWSRNIGCFVDYNFKEEKLSDRLTAAVFFPLWSKLASKKEAESIVHNCLPKLKKKYGLVTTLPNKEEDKRSGNQWDWPNGWAPLHWIAVSGLVKYGYIKEAKDIAVRWINLINDIFKRDGVIYEKYDVVSGDKGIDDRYQGQVGFSWTNAVFLRFYNFVNTGKLHYFQRSDLNNLNLHI